MKAKALIEKQGMVWESYNCGELWEIASQIHTDVIAKYVPKDQIIDAVKQMLSILDETSGCTGLVFEDE